MPTNPAPVPVIPPPPAIVPTSVLAWDNETKEVQVKPGEQIAHFAFYVTNVSPSEVLINNLRPSCGCTAAKLPETPWHLQPGQSGPIQADMNVAGKRGTVMKSLTVETSVGNKYLNLKAIIPDEPVVAATNSIRTDAQRASNLETAKLDRQAPLKGECAKCHVEPTVSKMGKDLYVAACAICHNAEHRATMVPDLQAKYKEPVPEEFWKLFIALGKPGTLMPAFAKDQGGFLTPEQMDSLAKYLRNDFPKEPQIIYHEVPMNRPALPGTPATNSPAAAVKTTDLLPASLSAFPVTK